MSETLAPAQQRGRDYTHSPLSPAVWLASLLLAACSTAPVDPLSGPDPYPAPATSAPPAAPTPAPANLQAAPRPAFQPAPRAPATHTVVKGDTLWDISAMFLRDPWKWPEIWKVNPQIQNPHLIYPGDIITLTFDADGRPILTASRDGQTYMSTEGADTSYDTTVGSAGGQVVKVSPRIRTMPLTDAIPTISTDAVRAFLSRNTVIDEDELEAVPYVVAPIGERLLSGSEDRMYVRGIATDEVTRFTVVRVGEPYEDPDTGAELGYEALFVAEAVVERFGDPGIVRIQGAQIEVKAGDRLLAGVQAAAVDGLTPRGARSGLAGKIIHVEGGVQQIGQYDVVVLNLGARDGVTAGDVFQIMKESGELRDATRTSGGVRGMLGLKGRNLDLPEERVGEVMVFRAHDRVSLALVLRATSEVHVEDMVRAP